MSAVLDPRRLAVTAVAMALFGAVVGVAFRKVARLLAVVVALQLVSYRYLESKGVVSLQIGATGAGPQQAGVTSVGDTTVSSLLSTGVLGASFAIGFAIGVSRT